MPEEKRIDPDDKMAYTYSEMAAYYKGKYKKWEVKEYWETCKPEKVSKGKGKAKAKEKAKAKSKPKEKAKPKKETKKEPKKPKPQRVIKIGAKFPDIELHYGFPPEKIKMSERLKGKKVPEYVKRFSELKAKGVDEVIVYCVNDGAVMTGWSKALGVPADGGVTLMGDPQSRLTRRVGMVLKHPGPMGVLGNPRCKRFLMVVDDGEVKALEVSEAEDDPAGDNNPSGDVTAKTRVDHLLTLL